MIVVVPYFLMAIASFFVKRSWYPFLDVDNEELFPILFLTGLLFLCFLPLFFIDRPIQRINSFPKQLHLMSIPLALLGLFSFFYQLPFALSAMEQGVLETRIYQQESNFLLPESIFTTIAVTVSTFYPIYLLVFYYYHTQRPKKIVIKYILLIGSLSYVVSAFTFASRGMLIYFIFTWLFWQSLFINKSNRLRDYRAQVYIILIGIVVLIFSASRFVGLDLFLYGTVGYIGQQPLVFTQVFEFQSWTYGGQVRFPLLFPNENGEGGSLLRVQNWEYMFGTFVKDLVGDFGKLGAALFCIVFSLFFSIGFYGLFPKKSFSYLLLLSLYVQFMSSGVFYMELGTRVGNLYMLAIGCLCLFLVARSAYLRQARRY